MIDSKFVANPKCKTCFGRGFIMRTIPTGKKKMVRSKTLCHCVVELKVPTPEDGVAPKVKMG